MTKQSMKDVTAKAVQVAKVSALVVVTALALTGTYVLSQPTLRSTTINYAQGEVAVQAESPKAN